MANAGHKGQAGIAVGRGLATAALAATIGGLLSLLIYAFLSGH